jgi:hypothetical protein
MVTGALEPDAPEDKLLCKFDLNPRSLVVWSFPFVPLLLAWTKQVLRVAANSVVFCGNSSRRMKMIALERTSSQSDSSGLYDWLLNNWLRVNDDCRLDLCYNLGLLNWILDNNLGLNNRLHVYFSKMVENNFSELDSINFVVVDKIKLNTLCRSVELGESDQVPLLKAKL